MPIEAFIDDRLSKTDLRVLGAIISFTDKKGKCWPRREQISERCGISVQKISYSTTRLITFGWLKKEGNGGCSRSANYYVLLPDLFKVSDLDTLIELDSIVPESGTFIVPELDTFIVPELGRGIKQTKEQTNEQTNILTAEKKDMKDSKDTFEKFYFLYPRKMAKKRAEKAWKKIKPEMYEIIIADVINRLANHDGWKDKTFIHYPATYLNDELWNDEITKKTSKAQQTFTNNTTTALAVFNKLTGVDYEQIRPSNLLEKLDTDSRDL